MKVLFLLVLCVSVMTAGAADFYVTTAGTTGADGTTWENAKTLDAALAVANPKIDIINSTITGNKVANTANGAGLYINNCTVNAYNSILSGNTDVGGTAKDVGTTGTSPVLNKTNIVVADKIYDGTGAEVSGVTFDPETMIGAFQDNGGYTKTCLPEGDTNPAKSYGMTTAQLTTLGEGLIPVVSADIITFDQIGNDRTGYTTMGSTNISVRDALECQIKIGDGIIGTDLTADFSDEVLIPCNAQYVTLLSRTQGSGDSYTEERQIEIDPIYRGSLTTLNFVFSTGLISFVNTPTIDVTLNGTGLQETVLREGDNWIFVTPDSFDYSINKAFNGCSNGTATNGTILNYGGYRANFKLDDTGNYTVLTPIFTIDFNNGYAWDAATFKQDETNPAEFSVVLNLPKPLDGTMNYWVGYNGGENKAAGFVQGRSNTVALRTIPGLESVTSNKIKITVNMNNAGNNWNPVGTDALLTTNIAENLYKNQVKLYSANQNLMIESSIYGDVKIYDMLAREIGSYRINDGLTAIHLNSGIYIVDINGYKQKVVVY